MYNCCWHGTLLRFSLQRLHLNNCYYHQDLQCRPLHLGSRPKLHRNLQALLLTGKVKPLSVVKCKWSALAPSIFRASSFGRWVVTHSLADFDFRDHRPAVCMNQHLLWDRGERTLWHFIFTFGSSHIAKPAYPVWPTSNQHSTVKVMNIKYFQVLTHLKFENRSRILHP